MESFDYTLTFYYTRDLAATDRFYHDLLGLEIARDQVDCHIYRVGTTHYIGFCQRAEAPETPAGVLLTLITADVDGWYERLTAQGVAFEKAPTLNPRYDIYHCFLRDPNGYLVEIQRFNIPL